MAGRPVSEGLCYFSFDVDFFDNPKIKSLRRRHGNTAVLFYLRLLCDVYRKGFYRKWDADYQEELKEQLGISDGQMQQVMTFLCERSLVDSKLLTSDTIITSLEIQRRFQQAVKERARKRPGGKLPVNVRFWLLDEAETEPFIQVTQKINIPGKNTDCSEKKEDCSQKNDTKESKVNKKNNNIVQPRKGRTVSSNPPSDFDRKCTDYLIQQCTREFPNAKVPHSESELLRWQLHIEKLRRIDGQEETAIWNVLVWTFNNSFWRTNIRSTSKFREKFETLYLQSGAKKGGNVNGSGSRPNQFNNFQQNDYDFDALEKELLEAQRER